MQRARCTSARKMQKFSMPNAHAEAQPTSLTTTVPQDPNKAKPNKVDQAHVHQRADRLAEDGAPRTPPSPRRDRRSEALAMNCTVVDLSNSHSIRRPKRKIMQSTFVHTRRTEFRTRQRPLHHGGVPSTQRCAICFTQDRRVRVFEYGT